MARLMAVPRARMNQWLTTAPKMGAATPPSPAPAITP